MPALSRKQITSLVVAFLITFFTSSVSSALFMWPRMLISKTDIVTPDPTPGPVELTYTEDETTVNFVLVGHGGAGHPGGGLADSIVLVSISPHDKKAKLVSVPRDLWVNLPSSENKINHAFAESPTALKDAVATVTGIRPEYFVSIDFVAFQRAIASLGGVTVDVPHTFDDYFYPIEGEELNTCGFSPEKMKEVHEKYSGFELEKQFTCRYEHLHFDKGPTEMEGGEALKFVRSRHSGQHGGDFARSQRQQALLLGIRDRLLELDAWKSIPDFFEDLTKFIKTDVEISTALGIADLIINPESYDVEHVYITTENVLTEGRSAGGAFILLPKAGMHNWNEVKNFVNK